MTATMTVRRRSGAAPPSAAGPEAGPRGNPSRALDDTVIVTVARHGRTPLRVRARHVARSDGAAPGGTALHVDLFVRPSGAFLAAFSRPVFENGGRTVPDAVRGDTPEALVSALRELLQASPVPDRFAAGSAGRAAGQETDVALVPSAPAVADRLLARAWEQMASRALLGLAGRALDEAIRLSGRA